MLLKISEPGSMDALSVVSWSSSCLTHYDLRLAVISNTSLHFRDLMANYLMSGSNKKEMIILPSQAKAQTVC